MSVSLFLFWKEVKSKLHTGLSRQGVLYQEDESLEHMALKPNGAYILESQMLVANRH